MISFEKGKPLSDNLIEKLPSGDYLKIFTAKPIVCILNLSDITEQEINDFKDEINIGFSLIESIPYLVIKFKNFILDTSIYSLEDRDIEENALTLVLVENNTKVVKDLRITGLDYKIIEQLLNNSKKNTMKIKEFNQKCILIEKKYSAYDIFEQSIIQQTICT